MEQLYSNHTSGRHLFWAKYIAPDATYREQQHAGPEVDVAAANPSLGTIVRLRARAASVRLGRSNRGE